MHEDSIAAIATPPGVGGIAVIRISGRLAEPIFHSLFRPGKPLPHPQNHHLYHGEILSSRTGPVLDEVMVCLMRKPHSYTGEDVLEIHCHGGSLVPQKILAAVIKAGARPAEAGEFTRRAFLNGRMDLSQAEAIADLIAARTDKGMEVALSHLKGDLGHIINDRVSDLTDILARLEADIDFTDDLDEMPPGDNISGQLQSIAGELDRLALTYEEGRIARNGAGIVIAGRANVGKSSLLNRLLGEKRAIVTPTPGTTRDFIEESIELQGIVLRITDTAGIRATDNDIEQAGIDLVWERTAAADVVIVLLDGSEPLTHEDRDIIERCAGKPVIPVINKMDLPHTIREEEIMVVTQRPPVWISAKYDRGMEALKETLYQHFTLSGNDEATPPTLITNLRHKQALEKAAARLSQAAQNAFGGASPELTAADIRDALDSLEAICGKTLNDDVLDRIFSKFCIGK